MVPAAPAPATLAAAPETGAVPDAPPSPDVAIITPALPGSGDAAAAGAMPGAVAAAPPDPAPALPPGLPPHFDLVRVEADGGTVIAGGSAPTSLVRLMMDGARVAEAVADPKGQFVILLVLPPSDAIRTLRLEAEMADGTISVSAQTVVLSPPAALTPPSVADAEGSVDAEAAAPETASVEAPPETAVTAGGTETAPTPEPAAVLAEASTATEPAATEIRGRCAVRGARATGVAVASDATLPDAASAKAEPGPSGAADADVVAEAGPGCGSPARG